MLTRTEKILESMHQAPREYTGAWWRGECDPNCKACQLEYELTKDHDKE